MASAVYYTEFYLSRGESLAMYRLRQVNSSPFSANKLSEHIPAESEGLSLLILLTGRPNVNNSYSMSPSWL